MYDDNKIMQEENPMLAVEMNKITKRFSGMVANDDITFRVQSGMIHCLLGENGAGKSTLMKVLFGLYEPEEGEIKINGQVINDMTPNLAYSLGIGMVHQHFMLVEELTVLENIILGDEPGDGLGIDYKKATEMILEISEKYGFDLRPNVKVSELSVGEMQRVEIMKTLYRGADVIILDEPTAVLTPLEVEGLLEVLKDMRADGKTIIFITHKLNETMAVSDRITVLRNGKSVCTINTSDTSPRELARLMVGEDMSFEIVKEDIPPGTEVVLELKDVALTHQTMDKVSLSIKAGEILGIAGVDGNGQQELEELIVGTRSLMDGDIYISGENISNLSIRERKKKGLGYIPADRFKYGIVNKLSLRENYLLGHQYEDEYVKNGIIQKSFLEKKSAELMKKFDVRAVNIDQTIDSLSGGNQQKLVLGREVDIKPQLVIASHPTRGLDIGATAYIKRTLLELKEEGKAILLISAELSDLFEISDNIAVLFKGEVMDVRPANEFTNESISLLMAGRKEES